MKISLLWRFILAALLQMVVSAMFVAFTDSDRVSLEVILFVAFVITWANNEEKKK